MLLTIVRAAIIVNNWKLIVGDSGPPDDWGPDDLDEATIARRVQHVLDGQHFTSLSNSLPPLPVSNRTLPSDLWPLRNSSRQLYDLSTDVREEHNLVRSRHETLFLSISTFFFPCSHSSTFLFYFIRSFDNLIVFL